LDRVLIAQVLVEKITLLTTEATVASHPAPITTRRVLLRRIDSGA
jgi:hypothetical protein